MADERPKTALLDPVDLNGTQHNFSCPVPSLLPPLPLSPAIPHLRYTCLPLLPALCIGIHAVTPRIYGGGFGKSDRFRSSGPVASPGPVYLVPSLMDTQHVQTNIYRQDAAPALSRAATATSSTGSPPRVSARTRSAWLMGSTIDVRVRSPTMHRLNRIYLDKIALNQCYTSFSNDFCIIILFF